MLLQLNLVYEPLYLRDVEPMLNNTDYVEPVLDSTSVLRDGDLY